MILYHAADSCTLNAMPHPIALSFEFFPPDTAAATAQLTEVVQRLAPLQPRFISVTCGADGAVLGKTPDCVRRLQCDTALCVAPHLRGGGLERGEVLALARQYWSEGVRQLVAIRGDPARAGTGAPGAGHGFTHAADLVRALMAVADFEISVAAYPEGHPESAGVAADVENLRRKQDAGARRAITQFFFDPDLYLRYRDHCRRAGVGLPIVPGIMAISKFRQLEGFAARCGAGIPAGLKRRFAALEGDLEGQRIAAAEVGIELVERLRRDGVDQFHFYTMNRAEPTREICLALGRASRPKRASGIIPRASDGRFDSQKSAGDEG